jgi:NAD(P)H-dependent FMN reductase
MKNILGIIGSPRKGGNCEITIKEISRNIPESHELHLLQLTDFNILPCKGCYGCLAKEGQCVLKDDIHPILDAMSRADAIILAAPTYFLGANAGLKRLIDRAFSFYAHIDRMWGTPSVGICIAGIPGKEGHGLLGVENFLKIAMTDIKMTRVLYGALPGEVFLNEENRLAATEMGNASFHPPVNRKRRAALFAEAIPFGSWGAPTFAACSAATRARWTPAPACPCLPLKEAIMISF